MRLAIHEVRSRSLHVRLRPRRILRTGLVLQVGVLHALFDRDVELRLCVVDLSAPTQVDPDNVAVTVTRPGSAKEPLKLKHAHAPPLLLPLPIRVLVRARQRDHLEHPPGGVLVELIVDRLERVRIHLERIAV